MATNAQNLDTTIANLYAELASITAAGKHTATISVRGHTYSLNEYRAQLFRDIKEAEQLRRIAGGPWEIRARNIV